MTEDHAIDEDRDVSIDEMLEFLSREGNLKVPCSRYGWDTTSCAPWAVACQLIYWETNGSGDSPLSDSLEFYMGLAVNDSDGVLSLIAEHGGFLAEHDHDEMRWTWEEAENKVAGDIERRLADLSMRTLLAITELIDAEDE